MQAAPATSQWQSLVLMAGCGQPDRVGAYKPGASTCQPSVSWTLAEFAQQLVSRGVLLNGESLQMPPAIASADCPLLVMRGEMSSGARLCFTAQGSVYRDAGGPRDREWAWRLDVAGQWTHEALQVVADTNN